MAQKIARGKNLSMVHHFHSRAPALQRLDHNILSDEVKSKSVSYEDFSPSINQEYKFDRPPSEKIGYSEGSL